MRKRKVDNQTSLPNSMKSETCSVIHTDTEQLFKISTIYLSPLILWTAVYDYKLKEEKKEVKRSKKPKGTQETPDDIERVFHIMKSTRNYFCHLNPLVKSEDMYKMILNVKNWYKCFGVDLLQKVNFRKVIDPDEMLLSLKKNISSISLVRINVLQLECMKECLEKKLSGNSSYEGEFEMIKLIIDYVEKRITLENKSLKLKEKEQCITLLNYKSLMNLLDSELITKELSINQIKEIKASFDGMMTMEQRVEDCGDVMDKNVFHIVHKFVQVQQLIDKKLSQKLSQKDKEEFENLFSCFKLNEDEMSSDDKKILTKLKNLTLEENIEGIEDITDCIEKRILLKKTIENFSNFKEDYEELLEYIEMKEFILKRIMGIELSSKERKRHKVLFDFKIIEEKINNSPNNKDYIKKLNKIKKIQELDSKNTFFLTSNYFSNPNINDENLEVQVINKTINKKIKEFEDNAQSKNNLPENCLSVAASKQILNSSSYSSAETVCFAFGYLLHHLVATRDSSNWKSKTKRFNAFKNEIIRMFEHIVRYDSNTEATFNN